MSDLISRSALISHIARKYWKYGAEYNAKQIWGDIEDFPIVFDLDKVIAELEQAKDDFHGGTLQTAYYWKGIDKAIEIINKYLSETAEPPKTDWKSVRR